MVRKTIKNGTFAVLASWLIASSAVAQLVVNEIDYDQDGTDTMEFVEIKNTGNFDEDLSIWSLRLVNGSGGGAAIYSEFFLPAVNLAAGDYYVICGDAAHVANCDLDVDPDSDLLQNGDPDAVALAFKGIVVDTVSYGGDTGAPYTEGSGVGLEDDSSIAMQSISRLPDGADTDMNNVDFSPRCATPGEPNTAGGIDCDTDELTLEFSGECPGEVTLTVSNGSPNSAGGIIFAPLAGSDTLMNGPCVGTQTGLFGPRVLTVVTFNSNGDAVLSRTAPANACGLSIQAVDGSTCDVSDVTTVGP